MSLAELIQSGVFATFLTACITIATVFLNEVMGYKKMKVENFDKISNSLIDFTEKRSEVVDKCNKMIRDLMALLPEEPIKMSEKEWRKKCYYIYRGINEILIEYSKCLELLLSFSFCLYKNKPISPIVTAECWSFLNLYEKFVDMSNMDEYKIRYAQIAALVQFIKVKGSWRDKIRIHKYLKRNKLS